MKEAEFAARICANCGSALVFRSIVGWAYLNCGTRQNVSREAVLTSSRRQQASLRFL